MPRLSVVSGYRDRPSWPPTEPQDTTVGLGTLLQNGSQGPVRVLREVGFPDFVAASYSGAEVGALLPSVLFGLQAGGVWSDARSVTLKVPEAESYSIPLQSAVLRMVEPVDAGSGQRMCAALSDDLRMEYCEGPDGNSVLKKAQYRLVEDVREGLEFVAAGGDSVWVRVITEVYYARAIDTGVGYDGGQGFGARVGASPIAGSTTSQAPHDSLTAVNNRLEQAIKRDAPGGGIRVLSSSQSGVSVRRTFGRAVAIGFRGLTVTVEANTGLILGVRVATSDVPTL